MSVMELIITAAGKKGPVLAGFDFGFSFPHLDFDSYFPGATHNPSSANELWHLVDTLSDHAPDLYAGPFCMDGKPFADFMNAPGRRGRLFNIRRHRQTEQACRKWTRPSSVFNAVGAGSVGMGSLAGMRMLHALRNQKKIRVACWPFDDITRADLVVLEIFPRLYVHRSGINPQHWRMPGMLRAVLKQYRVDWRGRAISTEDEFDALVSAAALRALSQGRKYWRPKPMTRAAARLEGWIFGVD